MTEKADYPEWSDDQWAAAGKGAPWMWDKDRTRRALDGIMDAIEARDIDAARELARRARADLD